MGSTTRTTRKSAASTTAAAKSKTETKTDEKAAGKAPETSPADAAPLEAPADDDSADASAPRPGADEDGFGGDAPEPADARSIEQADGDTSVNPEDHDTLSTFGEDEKADKHEEEKPAEEEKPSGPPAPRSATLDQPVVPEDKGPNRPAPANSGEAAIAALRETVAHKRIHNTDGSDVDPDSVFSDPDETSGHVQALRELLVTETIPPFGREVTTLLIARGRIVSKASAAETIERIKRQG